MFQCFLLKSLEPQGTRLLAVGALLSTMGFVCSVIQMDILGCVGMGLQSIILALSGAQRFHRLTVLWYTLRLLFALAVVGLAFACVILKTTDIILAVISMVLVLFMLAAVLCESLKIRDMINKNNEQAEEIPTATFRDSTPRTGDNVFVEAVLCPVPDEDKNHGNETIPDIVPQ